MKTLGLLFIVIAGVHGSSPAQKPNDIKHPAQKPNDIKHPDSRWLNEFDDKLLFTCASFSTIGSVSSQHHSYYEDRLWDFQCKTTFSELPTCSWTNYVNNFDEEFTFNCPFGSIISGVEAYHENYYEDRRWKFYCCRVNNACNDQCSWTDYLNYFDDYFSWKVPDLTYLVGVSSYHNNYREDRRWKYQYCTQKTC
ncbi:hemagglutinin/amebocyte aggregation factor-like isoform X1 [Rhincodon typus]|uniref:hemagglutinin/amebocyte aggregation factor-like isoform X1 n=1 Tax=Rhincodon typus TaxID=259920 RepID=UPI00202DC0C2|nr:hemagglutinin/amebocyte aggregation factor-like isoform X1 [Rhincodon typus]